MDQLTHLELTYVALHANLGCIDLPRLVWEVTVDPPVVTEAEFLEI
jgi:hypothetical protein